VQVQQNLTPKEWAAQQLAINSPSWSEEDKANIASCFRLRLATPTPGRAGSDRTCSDPERLTA
jgi:hypothetical protein